MGRSRIILILAFLSVLPGLLLAQASNSTKSIIPVLSLLLLGDDDMDEKIPTLALMVATDTDKLEMAWIPGTDGVTPEVDVVYNIHLSADENFTLGTANLNKSVTEISQTEINGLSADTLYYSKVIAIYQSTTSKPSNGLQAKTYKYSVALDGTATVEKAEDLGLGKHTTSNGTTYTGGTPPTVGSKFFSEDVAGGLTLRTVDSASGAGGPVTVETSDASLTDIVDRGSVYSAFKLKLFDVASEAKGLPPSSQKVATSMKMKMNDGSEYSRIDWKDQLLSAEQINYAYNEEGLIVEPEGATSKIKLFEQNGVEQSFTATVTTEFEPELITEAEWGGIIRSQIPPAAEYLYRDPEYSLDVCVS